MLCSGAVGNVILATRLNKCNLRLLPKMPDVISPGRPLIPEAPEPGYFGLSQEHGAVVGGPFYSTAGIFFFQTNIIPLRIVFDWHQFPTNCPSTE